MSDDKPEADKLAADVIDALEDPVNRMIWDMHFRAGLTKAEVARQLDMHRSSVGRRVDAILALIPGVEPSEADTVKRGHLARLEDLEGRLVQTLNEVTERPVRRNSNGDPLLDHEGNPLRAKVDPLDLQRVSQQILRVLRERSRLLGLDAPQRVEVSGVASSPLDEERELVRASVEKLMSGETLKDFGLDDAS